MSKVSELLQALAAKLGTTVEELGPHVVAHVRVTAMMAIASNLLLALVFLCAGAYSTYRLYRWGKANKWKEDYHVTPMILAGIATVLIVVMCCAGALDNMPAVIEPTGATVRMLMGR